MFRSKHHRGPSDVTQQFDEDAQTDFSSAFPSYPQNATTAGACTGPNQFIDFFGRCQQVYGARGYNSPMDHSDPEHMKHMTSEQNKRTKKSATSFFCSMLFLLKL